MQRPGSRPLLNLLSRQARIGTWLFWGLAALAVAALLRLVPALLPEFGQPHWSLQGAGSFIAEGVYKTEYTADKQPFRWLSSASVLRLPLTAQPGTLKLRIQTGTAGGTPPRELIISGQEHIALAAHDEIRVYSLFVPQALAAQNQLSLELYSPRLDIPGEERDLGMRLWGLGWRRLDQNWPNGLWAGIALAGSLLGLAAILLRDWPARRQAAAARRPRSALAPAGSAAHGRWIDRTALFALALLYIALFSGHYYSFDGMVMFHEARSIAYDQTLHFREPLLIEPPVTTSKYGIGLPLLYVPGILLSANFQAYFGRPTPNMNYQHLYNDTVYTLAGAPIHLLATALTAYLIARFCRRLGLGNAAALWGFALFAIGSPALIYARGDFTQPLICMLWMAGMHAALGYRQTGRRRDALWCAFCAGYAILTRPQEGAMLVPALLAIALPHLNPRRYARREWAAILAVGGGAALGVAITLLVNRARYGTWLATGYVGEGWLNPFWNGLKGLLATPAHGLLWAFPALALAPAGLWILWKGRQRAVASVFAALIVVMIWSMSLWFMWWGGESWGPRLILPTLPLLAVLAGAALGRLGRTARACLGGALLLAGLAWSIPGVLTDILAGYSQLVNSPLATFDLEGLPLVSAWRFLDRALATSLTDNRTIDILWLRLAQTTRGLSLIPMLACLGGSAWLLRRLVRGVRQTQPAGVSREGAAETFSH